jgi:hypothetical protein
MISTATAFTRACAKHGSGPTIIQTTNVTIATAITMQVGSSSGSGSGKTPCVYPRLSSSLLEAERGGRRTGRAGRYRTAAGHQRQVQVWLPISGLVFSIAEGRCWMMVPSAVRLSSSVSQLPAAMA